MTVRSAVWISLLLLALAGVALSEDPSATLSSVTGEVLLGDGPDAVALVSGKTIPKGAPLNLKKGAKATVVFEDDSRMSLVGPARVTVMEMTPELRRIDLASGRITSLAVGEVMTGVHTPHNAFAVLREGTIGVHVKDGQSIFNLYDGAGARVVDVAADKSVELSPNSPYVVGGPADPAPKVTGPGTADVRRIKVGDRLIKLSPKDGFEVTATETGGVSLKCTVAEAEFGSVQLGTRTVFYVGGGDVLKLDSAGNVISSEGVVHTQWSALDARGIYDDAIRVPGDSSRIHVD